MTGRPVFYVHVDSCHLCADALVRHDRETPACGDATCRYVGLCELGTRLRAAFIDPEADSFVVDVPRGALRITKTYGTPSGNRFIRFADSVGRIADIRVRHGRRGLGLTTDEARAEAYLRLNYA